MMIMEPFGEMCCRSALGHNTGRRLRLLPSKFRAFPKQRMSSLTVRTQLYHFTDPHAHHAKSLMYEQL